MYPIVAGLFQHHEPLQQQLSRQRRQRQLVRTVLIFLRLLLIYTFSLFNSTCYRASAR